MRKHLVQLIVLCAMALLSAAAPARADFLLSATLTGAQERPNPINTTATGTGSVFVNDTAKTLTFNLTTSGLAGNISDLDVHIVPAGLDPLANNGDVRHPLLDLAGFTSPIPNSAAAFTLTNFLVTGISQGDINDLRAGRAYFNVHDTIYSDPVGEIRGNLGVGPEPASLLLTGSGVAILLLGYTRRCRKSAAA